MSAHLQKITNKAKQLRKQHPNKKWTDLVKMASKLLKTGKVSGVKRPKKATTSSSAAKKVKVKVRKTKGGNTVLQIGGISGVSLSKVKTELTHQGALTKALNKHRAMLTTKGLKPAEKVQIRRDIAHYRNAIAASKKHVSALKRSI